MHLFSSCFHFRALLYKSGKFIQCNSINDVQLSLMSHSFVMTKVTKRTTMKPQSSYISISESWPDNIFRLEFFDDIDNLAEPFGNIEGSKTARNIT